MATFNQNSRNCVTLLSLIAIVGVGARTSDRLDPGLLSSVVRIETAPDGHGDYEIGTGFLLSTTGDISGKTLLITNKHVISDWNYADQGVAKYHPWINVFFYRTGDPSGQAYRPTKIDLLNRGGSLDVSRVYMHPNASIDLAAVDVTGEINNDAVEHIRSVAFGRSFLLPFGKFQDYQTDIGDQVVALGYPLGIRSLRNDYPIAKVGYIASLPGQEVSIPQSVVSRAGVSEQIVLEGKFLIIDGLIVNGNSGSPVVLAGGVRVGRDPKTNQLQFTSAPLKNFVIGVVSEGLGGGLTVVVSSDYLIDLMDRATAQAASN